MELLIVEDECHIAELIRQALSQLGLRGHIAASTDDADRQLRERNVEAMTLDLGMPGRNGLDWLEDIAVRRPELTRRTLVVTGQYLESALVERLARCGAGILAKPFEVELLHEAVRTQIVRSGVAAESN